MQETRRLILEILRKRGQATVDDLVAALQEARGNITSVTVRHHLSILQSDELITAPQMRRKTVPGRPQHVYALTDKARGLFPNNYQTLAQNLLIEIQRQLPPDRVNVIMEGVAAQMTNDADIPPLPLPDRMGMVVQFLNDHGYEASWETSSDGFILHTRNCPYHVVAADQPALCDMDMRLVAGLLGIVPRRMRHMTQGDATCSYFIPSSTLILAP